MPYGIPNSNSWRWKDLLMTLVVVVMVLMIPFGIGMALYMNDERWLIFCGTLIFFLS